MTDVESRQTPDNTANDSQPDDLVSARLTAVHQVLSELDGEQSDDLVLGDESAATAQTMILSQSQTPEVSSEQPPPTAASSEDSDDSIEDYMAALLAGSQGSSPAASQASVASQAPVSQPALILDENDTAETGEAAPQRSFEDMAEKRQQSQSEVRNNLSTMRELANMNSRNAIETHNCKQLVQQSLLHLGLAAGGLTLSFMMVRSVTALASTSFVAAVAGTLAATFGAIQFFRITGRLRKTTQAIQTTQSDQ